MRRKSESKKEHKQDWGGFVIHKKLTAINKRIKARSSSDEFISFSHAKRINKFIAGESDAKNRTARRFRARGHIGGEENVISSARKVFASSFHASR